MGRGVKFQKRGWVKFRQEVGKIHKKGVGAIQRGVGKIQRGAGKIPKEGWVKFRKRGWVKSRKRG